MRLPRILRPRSEPNAQQRGAVLILVAVSMVSFMGMAAFAVDLGWILLQSTNVQKAAEAAALAGVSYMPLEEPLAAGAEIPEGVLAADVVDAIAVEHGYSAAGTTAYRWSTSTQVRVEVSARADTFFLAFLGIDSIALNRHAIADEQLPLKLGSDGSTLGSASDRFWLAINGERRRKEDGDPFSTRCVTSSTNSPCGGTPNALWRDPAYYYAVEIGQSDVDSGRTITVSVYDGSSSESGVNQPNDIVPIGATPCPVFAPACTPTGGNEFTFSLIEPDSTPGDPGDNRQNSINSGNASGEICSQVFGETDGINSWVSLCSFSPTQRGVYVLEVKADGDLQAINGFALRARGGTATSVYGIGYMSLWMRDVGSQPTLQIVKIGPEYAGTQLIVSAFDLGDISGSQASAYVTFGGSLAGVECRVRTLDHNFGNASAWRSDDSSGAPCKLTTKNSGGGIAGIYNNEWVEFVFDIPSSHTCNGSGCWATVTYVFSNGEPYDRTTWSARLNGTPVHLISENTPLP
jgi:hypothetical protein